MAKKGESDEKVQAGAGPEARGETVSGEPGEREAAALVAGGDRGAAEGEGAQPEAPAPGAAGDGSGVVSDDQGNGDRAGIPQSGDQPHGAGTGGGTGDQRAAGQDHEKVDNGDGDGAKRVALRGSDADDFGAAMGDAVVGLAPNGGTAAAGKAAGEGPAAAAAAAADQPAVDAGNERGVHGVSDGAAVPSPADVFVAALVEAACRANAGSTETLDGAGLDDDPVDFGDIALQAAIEAYEAALLAGAVIGAVTAGTDALDPDMTDGAYDEIGAFVRKIGRRATPDVIGQQLKILGHRASPDLSEPERIAFGAFAHVLVELDAFAAAEAERAKRAAETPAEIPPLPIEDTTMETVDNALDTWG